MQDPRPRHLRIEQHVAVEQLCVARQQARHQGNRVGGKDLFAQLFYAARQTFWKVAELIFSSGDNNGVSLRVTGEPDVFGVEAGVRFSVTRARLAQRGLEPDNVAGRKRGRLGVVIAERRAELRRAAAEKLHRDIRAVLIDVRVIRDARLDHKLLPGERCRRNGAAVVGEPESAEAGGRRERDQQQP